MHYAKPRALYTFLLLVFVVVSVSTITPALAAERCAPIGSETVETDKPSYQPFEVVHVAGTGYSPECDVVVRVTRPDGSVVTGDGSGETGSDTVSTDAAGAFAYDYQLADVAGIYTVDVIGSGDIVLATTEFSDAARWTLSVSPTSTRTDKTRTYTFTATNTSTSNANAERIGCVKITIPAAFALSGTPSAPTASGAKSWSASKSGNVLTAIAVGVDVTNANRLEGNKVPSDSLSFTQDVTAPAATTGSPFTWSGRAWGRNDCTATGPLPEFPAPIDGQPTVTVTDNHVPGAPTLTAPDDGATTSDATPTFSWDAVVDEDADTVSYHIKVDDDGCAFPSPTVDQSGLAATSFTPASDLADDAYCWGVSASDGIGSSSFSTRTLTVATNGAPDAVDDTPPDVAEGAAATAIDVLANDTDPDGDTPTVTDKTDGAKGSVVITGGGTGLTYQPTGDENGADSFTYTISDGNGGSDTATVSITITEVNDAPDAANDTATVAEDSATGVLVDVLANDDPGPANESSQTIALDSITDPADSGTAVIESGKIRYTPGSNFNGSDIATYKVCDDGTTGGSPDEMCSEATLTITVTPDNDKPVATDGSDSTDEDVNEDVDLRVLVSDQETADANLTYTITDPPDHGTLTATVTIGVLTYDPADNYNGADSFKYTVTDRGDPDDCGTPDDDCAATKVSDEKTVSLTVNPINDAPDAVNDSKTVAEDSGATEITVLANDTDVEDDTLTITAKTDGAKGVVAIIAAGTKVTYTPNLDENGADSFTYTISDGNGGSDTATVSITITEVNDAPDAVNDTATVAEDSATGVLVDVLANDDPGPADESGQNLTLDSITDAPDHGSAAIESGKIRYTPAAQYNGPDTLTYKVCDDGTTNGVADPKCATADLNVTVTPDNDKPVANDGSDSTDEDVNKDVDLRGLVSDVETDDADLTYTITDGPDNGTLTPTATNGVLTYDPAGNYNGPDEFKYTVTDRGDPDDCGTPDDDCAATKTSDEKTVNLTVNPVNDTPGAEDFSDSTDEDVDKDIDLRGHVADVETSDANLTYTITDAPDHGSLTPTATNGVLTYDPDLNYNGADSFKYTVTDRGDPDGCGAPDADCDDAETSAEKTASITVNAVNDVPVLDLTNATPQTVDYSDAIASFTISASDVDDDPSDLTFSATGLPAGVTLSDNGDGTATISGTITAAPGDYTPTYKATDPDGAYDEQAGGTITVEREGATAGYTGQFLWSTGSPSGTSALVNLKAQVDQDADGSLGDITKAKVVFRLWKGGNTSATPDYTFGPVGPDATGMAEYSAALSGPEDYTVVVRFYDPTSYFDGPDSDPAVVTVYQPSNDKFVTLGGWIHDPSFEDKPVAISDENDHGNTGGNVKYKKGGSGTPSGHWTNVFRGADGYNYMIKSTSWESGQLAFTGTNRAAFSGKGVVQKIDPATGAVVWSAGNYVFRVDATDNGQTGDTYAYSVYTPGGALWHQAGTTASQIALGGGNIVVHVK